MDNKSKKRKGTNDSSPPPPRKGGLKFAPKVPPKKAPKTVPKMEQQKESKVLTIDKDLMMKLKTSQSTDALKRSAKADKEAHTEIAFGQVNSSMARSFPSPKRSSSVEQEKGVQYFSNSILSDVTTSAAKLPKECAEPQDYTHTKYPPITLPLRKPCSGNPDILDEDEFGEFSSSRAQDGELTTAEELGLMDTMDEPQLLFFQFPASLPVPRQATSVADTGTSEGVETEGTKSKENDRKRRNQPGQGSKLKELPGGLMGKLLVYKSGKVKMRLGDVPFDVSAGLKCTLAQEAVAINIREKHCISLGEVSERAIVTPDVDCMLDSIEKME